MLARHRSNMFLLLTLLLAGMLFPFGWLAEHWPGFNQVFDPLFDSEPAHWIGHAGIFSVLAIVGLRIWPALLRRPALYFGVFLAAALVQELIQRSYKGFAVTPDDLLDLGIDMAATAIVFLVARRQASQEPS